MASFPQTRSLADAALPLGGPFTNPRVRNASLVVGGAVFLALLAQVSLNVPFSADRTGQLVPITGQTFGVLFIGITLGARRSLGAVVLYLAVGLLGAPVFTQATGGASALFAGASSGYLWGFLLAAPFVGWCAERGLDRGPWLYAVLFIGNAMVYAIGLPVLHLWLSRHGLSLSTLDAGLWPFIAGDLAKLMAVSLLVPTAWSAAKRSGRG